MDAGSLVPVAAQGDAGWFLLAIDPRLDDLDRAIFPDAAAAERAARSMLRRGEAQATNHWKRDVAQQTLQAAAQ